MPVFFKYSHAFFAPLFSLPPTKESFQYFTSAPLLPPLKIPELLRHPQFCNQKSKIFTPSPFSPPPFFSRTNRQAFFALPQISLTTKGGGEDLKRNQCPPLLPSLRQTHKHTNTHTHTPYHHTTFSRIKYLIFTNSIPLISS